MKKLVPLVWGLAVLVAFASAQEDFSKVQIKVVKVSGSVYMLQGAGGNIGASVGEDGIVLIDDQYAPLADRIQAALKGITDKPVRFVINTHFHLDHTGSNAYFQKQAPVIAHENVRKRLESGGTAGNLGDSIRFEYERAPKEGLPIITFEHDVTVHLNGEDIRALHFPSGHTDGDAIIFFPKSNVVHMGDDFMRIGFPFIDLASGGSVAGMIAALQKVVVELPPDVRVIPGHGDISNLDDVRKYTAMLIDTRAVVEQGIKQGKTFDQLKKEDVLGRWKSWSNEFITTDAFLETLYNDLTGKHDGELKRHN